MAQVYALTQAPVDGRCPYNGDRFVHKTPHHLFGWLYHYYGRLVLK